MAHRRVDHSMIVLPTCSSERTHPNTADIDVHDPGLHDHGDISRDLDSMTACSCYCLFLPPAVVPKSSDVDSITVCVLAERRQSGGPATGPILVGQSHPSASAPKRGDDRRRDGCQPQ